MSTKTGKNKRPNFRKGQKCPGCMKSKLEKPDICKGCSKKGHLICKTCGWCNF